MKVNQLTLDFETTNTDKGDPTNAHNYVVLACFKLNDGQVQHEWEGAGFPRLREAVASATILVAHNVKFELQWLANLYISTEHVDVYDTMLGEFVLAGNRRVPLGLDAMAKSYGFGQKSSFVSNAIGRGVCPSSLPKRWVLEYCANDVELTAKIKEVQEKKLRSEGLWHIAKTRFNMAQALAEVEMGGLVLDKDKVYERHEGITGAYEKLRELLARKSEGTNWNSSKQVGAYIYDVLKFEEPRDHRGEVSRTEGGNRRTDEAAILSLDARTKEQREWLDLYREFVPLKRKVTDLNKMKACVDSTGVVYANINQTVAQTHRTTSTGKGFKIQIQNVDRDFKDLFTRPSEDYYVVEVDAKQLEFRGGAELTRDPVALKDIWDLKDIHKFSGSVIFKKPESQVVGEIRTAAKKHTFKPLFAGNSGTKDEKRYYEAFRQRYNVMYETQKGWTYEVLKTKQLVTSYGMKFYWPDTRMKEDGFITNTPSIFNYPIQSFCTAEIVPIAVYNVWKRLSGMRSYLVNTVHDSIVAYVHKDEIKEFIEICEEAFIDAVRSTMLAEYGRDLKIPLGIEIKAGTYWGDHSLMFQDIDEVYGKTRRKINE